MTRTLLRRRATRCLDWLLCCFDEFIFHVNFKQLIRFSVGIVVVASGCAPQSVPRYQPALPPPVDTTTNSYSRGAVAGQRQLLMFYGGLQPDCSPAALPTVRWPKMPDHGAVSIEYGEDFPRFILPDPRVACDRLKRQGTALFYTPSPWYTGQDSFQVILIGADGWFRNDTYAVTIVH